MFSQFFSLDSAKAIKARDFGFLNGINYMAPAATAGVGNLCPNASAGCLALCLGWYSGQASMVSDQETGTNSARASRQAKARMFMKDRETFLNELTAGIMRAERAAKRKGLKLCLRLNGATDIGWEGIRNVRGADGRPYANVFAAFPHVQFVDYTKSVRRALAHAEGKLPSNYHLTFSRSETNEADCAKVLDAGGNVAVVFAGELPPAFGFDSGTGKGVISRRVVDGDDHDLRHLDPRAGVVIGLYPKGNKAKRDTSGFVVR